MISAAVLRSRPGPLAATRAALFDIEMRARFRRERLFRSRLRLRESDTLLDLVEECRIRGIRPLPPALWSAVVLLAWENEAHLALKEFGADKFEIVTPPLSILAEPPVAVVEKNAKRHHTTEVANEYLKYLYSDEGQEIAAKNFYRPRNEEIANKYAANFTPLKLVTLDAEFGSWASAQKTHFADGGVFDQIYQP